MIGASPLISHKAGSEMSPAGASSGHCGLFVSRCHSVVVAGLAWGRAKLAPPPRTSAHSLARQFAESVRSRLPLMVRRLAWLKKTVSRHDWWPSKTVLAACYTKSFVCRPLEVMASTDLEKREREGEGVLIQTVWPTDWGKLYYEQRT